MHLRASSNKNLERPTVPGRPTGRFGICPQVIRHGACHGASTPIDSNVKLDCKRLREKELMILKTTKQFMYKLLQLGPKYHLQLLTLLV